MTAKTLPKTGPRVRVRAALERAATLLNMSDCPVGSERNRLIVVGNGIRATLKETVL